MLSQCFPVSSLDGAFTPQDIKLGLHYLNQAAEQGMAEAEVILARLYATGNEVEQSNSKAFDLYLRAAFSNNTFALYMVGTYLLDGRCGFPATDAIAFEWFLRAAERGDADGQAQAGNAYLYGIGIEKNSEKALFWIQKGLAQKNKHAYYSMSQLCREESSADNEIKAFGYLELSAEAGYTTAQFELALCLLKGSAYVKQDIEKAMNYLKLAKELNHSESIDLYQKLQGLSLYEQDIALEAPTSADKIKPEEEKTAKTRASSYTNQAKALYINRNYAQAISFFQKALKLNLPNKQPELICNIAHSYFALKDFNQAINFYSKAINMLPEQSSLYSWRAKCYRKLAIQSEYTDTEKQAFIENAENNEQKIAAEANKSSYRLK
ncbi:tetratricopeptide repeat protein [Rickettsiella endosymbiont of Dermanyssus gallinae]|uniref:tetratricopeptide repeat protein n=1 Tax=Rickettsiella endosymbiont of Dermanyssus gallinae TaxID=2856608 RepID=UPI001C52F4F6|nr:SEL1-like repeat protein [Rickettsiella endosymbiont of Dermanyssus gallinae]